MTFATMMVRLDDVGVSLTALLLRITVRKAFGFHAWHALNEWCKRICLKGKRDWIAEAADYTPQAMPARQY